MACHGRQLNQAQAAALAVEFTSFGCGMRPLAPRATWSGSCWLAAGSVRLWPARVDDLINCGLRLRESNSGPSSGPPLEIAVWARQWQAFRSVGGHGTGCAGGRTIRFAVQPWWRSACAVSFPGWVRARCGAGHPLLTTLLVHELRGAPPLAAAWLTTAAGGDHCSAGCLAALDVAGPAESLPHSPGSIRHPIPLTVHLACDPRQANCVS